MAPGTAMGAAGDAPLRLEHARPPGWAPLVRPPPAPVVALPAAALRPAPPPARPRPASAAPSAASAAAVPAQPAAPAFFGILAWILGFRVVDHAEDLLTAGAATGVHEAAARMAQAGSLACGAALVLGLMHCERWVGRAAVVWAGSLALRRIIEQLGEPTYLASEAFWGTFIFPMIIPFFTAAYVWDRARTLPPAPAPAPSP